MTVYPIQLDSDNELPPVDDNITEIGGEAINRLREAVFAIEETLGLNPQGTVGTLADRLFVSINLDGTIKASAVSLLLTNIIDAQVAAGAGIKESKLDLDFGTTALKNYIDAVNITVGSLTTTSNNLIGDFILHLSGQTPLSMAISGRHIASHLDLNTNGMNPYAYGVDPRDPAGYLNPGLRDKYGNFRTCLNVLTALSQINSELIGHENLVLLAHVATAISLDTSGFTTIPSTEDNVQKAIDYIDAMATEIYEEHRAAMHSNAINNVNRSEDYFEDGYVEFISGPFACQTYLNANGNDFVVFSASVSATAFELNRLFRIITIGDYININYGGYVVQFTINSISLDASSNWVVKIDGINSADKVAPDYAYVTFDKKKFDENIYGSLAVCSVNHNLNSVTYGTLPRSVIVVDPRCAQATGLDLNLEELDSTHYNLYLAFYPDGTPNTIVDLPVIDVTGNAGATPGCYTLHQVVNNINNTFRAAGYNYRMVAFEYNGQIGLSIGDIYGNPGFSIISGETNNAGVLVAGSYVNNVIGNDRIGDYKDALGFGRYKASIASPYYGDPTTIEGSFPTKIFVSHKNRNYSVFGKYKDYLAKDSTTNADGYWTASLFARVATAITIEVTYRVNQDLTTSKIRAGSTIVVQPTVSRSDPLFLEQDYGRFIVKTVSTMGCPPNMTDVTVINGVYGTGNPTDNSSTDPLDVIIYFCDDCVTFDEIGINDSPPGAIQIRKHYEIFVDKNGKTEPYERARFNLASGAGKIETTYGIAFGQNYGWHILQVSPKLKGYTSATGGTADRYFVEFVIFNYNATDGSYDGQLRQTSGGTIYTGPVARVRKGEVGRYYDATGVDYMDILFNQSAASSPAAILSSAIDVRTLEIEVFPSQRNNSEFMCLGTCEHTRMFLVPYMTGYITDLRQFGSVSEKVLSTSAISFIEAGERFLHENGVINDFDYVSRSGYTLQFNGGIGVVNGRILSKNNFAAVPNPTVYFGLGSSTVIYAVCLNDKGNIELVLLNSTSSQVVLLAVTGGTSKHENSYTLADLVNKRKDLLPLWGFSVSSTIVGTTPTLSAIFAPFDLRRYVSSGNIHDLYVTCSPQSNSSSDTRQSTVFGNFKTLKAALNYVYYVGLYNNHIKINGTTYVDEDLDISTPTDGSITIEGERGNEVICSTTISFKVTKNATIKGLNFVRKLSSGGNVNALPYSTTGLGLGTIVVKQVNGSIVSNNITIEDCTFTTDESVNTYRLSSAPHILFEQVGDGGIFRNINIVNNKFYEKLAQLDIAFVNRGGIALGSDPTKTGTMLIDVNIENNVGGFLSYIMLSSDNSIAAGDRRSRGLSAYGVKITRNTFDYMWINLSRFVFHGFNDAGTGLYSNALPPLHPGVLIEGNTFTAITNNTISGRFLFGIFTGGDYPVVASPSTIISKNKCTSIEWAAFADTYRGTDINYPGEVIISDNILSAAGYSGTQFGPSDNPVDTAQFNGIFVGTNAQNQTKINFNVLINNNTIVNPYDELNSINTCYYVYAINTTVPAKVSNNVIKKCLADGGASSGIYYNLSGFISVGDDTISGSINDNWIERGDKEIYAYISVLGTTKIKDIQIVDNYFDTYYVDAAASDRMVIKYNTSYGYKFISQRNIGQYFIVDLTGHVSENFPPNDSGILVGWKHHLYLMPSTNLVSAISTTIDQIYVTDASYYVVPLIINLPYLDGAKPFAVQFTVHGLAPVTPGGTAQVMAFTQDTVLSREVTYPAPIATQYTVIPGTFDMTNPLTPTNIVIDLWPLYQRYPLMISHSRTLPLYIVFIDDNAYPNPTQLVKAVPDFDQIYIYNINGYFIY